MQLIKRGDTSPAGAEVRAALADLELLSEQSTGRVDGVIFDAACELALREFQQSRGLNADGIVGPETWRALVAARWRLGDRILNLSLSDPMLGDDVHQLQERLLEMGYDVDKADGVFDPRTEQALVEFQRDCGLVGDGVFGPGSMRTLNRLGRKVVGGRPQMLRESARLDNAGPALSGKRVVIDPGHGGQDSGIEIAVDGSQWSEAELCHDLALRLEGRFTAVGVQAHLTRGPDSNPTAMARAEFANSVGADILISLHSDRHDNP
ncbi:MAG: N-acetylmuramoyl-L-alanine amidase, partial [Steroidobacteraceae bacterium]